MEVDNLCITQLIASSSVPCNAYSQLTLSIQELLKRNAYSQLTLSIQEDLKREWLVHIKHIYREANFAADSLTVGLYIFNSPPASINHILLHDCMG